MKIAIVDGDRSFLDSFRHSLIEELSAIGLQDTQIDTFQSGEEFLEALDGGQMYSLLLSETELPNMNGIELAREIRRTNRKLPIVYISATNDYAMETYEVGASYYIQKPIATDELKRLLCVLVRITGGQNHVVTLPDGFGVMLREVYYIKPQNQNSVLYLTDQSTYISNKNTEQIQYMFEIYPCFYILPNGTIVNFAKVKEVTTTALLLENNHYVPVSRSSLRGLREAYGKFQRLRAIVEQENQEKKEA